MKNKILTILKGERFDVDNGELYIRAEDSELEEIADELMKLIKPPDGKSNRDAVIDSVSFLFTDTHYHDRNASVSDITREAMDAISEGLERGIIAVE